MGRRLDLRPAGVCLLVSGGIALFAWHQNMAGSLGGPASLAHVLWLNLTILVFLVMPLLWWRWSGVHPDLKLLFAIGFAAFFARTLIEMPVLYLTTGWRCLYGIVHDLGVFAILSVGYLRCRQRLREPDRLAEGFLGLYLVLLVAEAAFAWTFSQLASPAAGVYFAADTPHFAELNVGMWSVVIAAYPLLGMVVWRWASVRR